MGELSVSIILPVYNRESSIQRAVDSILEQTYQDFELIIIDDASSDQTGELIKAYKTDKIYYIRLEKNVGAAAARNVGIKAARYEWLSFHDSDDTWHPEKLEKQVALIDPKDEHPPIIYCSFFREKSGKREYIPEPSPFPKEGDILKSLLIRNFISTQTVLLRKDYLTDVGLFDEEMPRFQDWELWIRLAQKYSFRWLDEPLVNVFYTESSISSEIVKLLEAFRLIMTKHYQVYEAAGAYYVASLLFSYGHNLCLAGDTKQGRYYLLRAYRENKGLRKSGVSILVSLLGKRGYSFIYSLLKK
ncbi:glycosyltransferase family 2 protein [Pullulanibacillus sp. KACC 23026]|uniref:glycosyltransferase family 2 protein n=1 Tax=Pullulanibacillus sp. KACC 23026 TaxID=3028315 RepID=UPI0023B0DDAD|nr:glycosyltransferase family 2 protein [Pullulanibacillus sp. KACC 23026]WEG13300.1 glycosyltransferase family 2 protein [Pullulanibacillus sp. KACC 23026]